MNRIIEHLKYYSGIIIDAYRDGSGPGSSQPMTPDMAKALIWNEIQKCLSEKIDDKNYCNLRISGNSKNDIFKALIECGVKNIISIRWLGPRNDGDLTVAYVVLNSISIVEIYKMIEQLESLGLSIRDGSYGI